MTTPATIVRRQLDERGAGLGRHQRAALMALGLVADRDRDLEPDVRIVYVDQVAKLVGLAVSTTRRTLLELAELGYCTAIVDTATQVRQPVTGRRPGGAVRGFRTLEEVTPS